MLKKIILQILILGSVLNTSSKSAESGGMPQLNPEFWVSQIFWLILTFGILYIVLSKLILPKISENLETRKPLILENIETAGKQKEGSEMKIKEFEKIINQNKIEAKNYFNEARQKILEDINKKKTILDKEIDNQVKAVENEIKILKNSSNNKINKIAVETSSYLLKELIGEEVNYSSVSAIVEEKTKNIEDKQNAI